MDRGYKWKEKNSSDQLYNPRLPTKESGDAASRLHTTRPTGKK